MSSERKPTPISMPCSDWNAVAKPAASKSAAAHEPIVCACVLICSFDDATALPMTAEAIVRLSASSASRSRERSATMRLSPPRLTST